jgi:hypothetical protein
VFGGGEILVDNNIVEKDAPNIVVVDAAGRAVLGAVLASSGPKISLEVERVSKQT